MSKYSEIAMVLKDEIGRGVYSEEGKLPTEFDLSARFKVSRQTVRQAISSLKNEGDVYQIQGSGTYISKGDSRKKLFPQMTNTILVICTYISDYIFPSIIRGIESELSSAGFNMNLCATGNKVDQERKILNSVIENHNINGIIVEGTKTSFPSPNISLYQSIEELGIPVVFLHCAYPELPDSIVVGMKDYDGGKIAAKALLDEGCKKLGAIFKSDDRQGILRYSGFIDGVLESGLSLANTEVRWYTTEDLVDHGARIDSDQIRVLNDAGIDGIVCYNDLISLAIIRDFIAAGFNVPKIISFDNSYLCSNSASKFRSLGHKKEYLGKVAAKKIMNMVAGEPESSVLMDWD